MTAYWALLVFTALERLVEVRISNANARWSIEHGGKEVGQGHFPVMVALHACFLASCALEPWLFERSAPPAVAAIAFLAAMGCQALRWWCIATLGRQWNTRVIVVPGFSRITAGPYRWLSHPNYVAVVVEGIALPAVGGAWITATVFTFCNAILLRTRLRTENRALAKLSPGGLHGLAAGS